MRVQFGRGDAKTDFNVPALGMGMGRLQSPRPYLIVLRSPGPCGPEHQALLLPWAPGPGHPGPHGHGAFGSELRPGLDPGLVPYPLVARSWTFDFLKARLLPFEGVLKHLCT